MQLQSNTNQSNNLLINVKSSNSQSSSSKKFNKYKQPITNTILQQEQIIILVKFNDEQLIKQINQQFFEQQLKKYSLQERKYLIIDRNSLKIIDTRQQNAIEQFKQKQIASKSTLHTIQKSNNINQSNLLVSRNSNTNNNNNSNQNSNSNQSEFLDETISNIYHRQRTTSHLNKSSIWQNHWKQSQKTHQQFLSSICQNNFIQFNKFLNKRQTTIPIQINYRSQSNWCPIHYAAMHCTSAIMSRLINYPQIDINIVTDFNLTALHIAVQSNKIDNCELLIHAGICIDYKDKQNYTALHYAAQFGYRTIIELLIKNGASQYIKNIKSMTPKEICQSQDLLKLFKNQPNSIDQQQSYHQRFYKLKRNAFVQKMITSSPQSNNNLNQSSHNISYNQSHTQQKQYIQKTNHKNNKIQNQNDKKLYNQINSNQKQKLTKTASNNRKKNIFKMYQLIINTKSQPITLSSFRFYKKIGQGAFGQVYVVRKLKSDKFYALKAIKKQRVIGTALYRYIQTQKQILSLISHPFVVKLNCAFQTQAYLFLVMDYCQGGDLSRLLQKKQRLQQKVVKMYAAQILLGLQALHKNMIIYRDLKPQNIVLDKDGHACITDFGLSKKTIDLDAVNKSFCGTPAYLPLQIINKKGHTRMADWYEYGIVLYQLLTGIPPFYAQTKTQLYDKVRAGVIRFPKNSSELFRDLIKKLLAQNPQKRLGFQKDADSIKQHQWFKDINWQEVQERKLPVPPIQNKIKVPSQPIKTKFADIKSEKYFIPSWSFVD